MKGYQLKQKARKARRLARELSRACNDLQAYMLTDRRDHPATELFRSAHEFAAALYGLTIAADNAIYRAERAQKRPDGPEPATTHLAG